MAFFDATYAVALTLLVTTLHGTDAPDTWRDLAGLWAVFGHQIVAFFLAFTIVAFYWRASHAFVAGLQHLTGRLITVNLVLLAFVVLLPFSTNVLGEHQEPLATAVFAANVAVISSTEAAMSRLVWREGPSALPSPQGRRLDLAFQLLPPAIFLASIPVAYLVSSSVARLSWLALLLLNPVMGILVRSRARRA